MKKYFLLFLTILSYSQNKTIVPKNGAIVFEKKGIITDTLLYKNSFEKVFDNALPEMKKELLNEISIKTTIIPDSTNQKINQILEMMKSMTMYEMFSSKSKEIIKFHHIYTYSVIDEQISLNGEISNNNLIYTLDSSYVEVNKIVSDVQEYKNETKTIKGFKCFKVVMYYFDLQEPPGLNKLLNISELWVTDKIKSKFHPIIKESEILDKYYPLEIKHKIKNVEGMFTLYEISEFSLK